MLHAHHNAHGVRFYGEWSMVLDKANMGPTLKSICCGLAPTTIPVKPGSINESRIAPLRFQARKAGFPDFKLPIFLSEINAWSERCRSA
jgi:hypothetical protein